MKSLPLSTHLVARIGAAGDLAGLVVAACTLMAVATSGVSANDWTNAAGGSFQNSGNWSGGVPGAGDDARFVVVGGDYTVTFSANAASDALNMTQSTVTLDLNGRQYNVNRILHSNDSSTFLKLRITDGNMNVANGVSLQWNRTLEVTSGGNLDVNGAFSMGPGTNNSSRSTVLISGTGSQISADGLFNNGAWGGTATIESNGTLTTTGASILRTTASFVAGNPSTLRGGPLAEVIIGNAGTWTSGGQITLGGTSGEGAIYVDSGGLLDTSSVVLDDIDSVLEVGGGSVKAGSLTVNAGSLSHRDGTVTIDGGTFNPGASLTGSATDFHIMGASAGDHATVTLDNGAQWNAARITVGRGMNGTLNVNSDSDVTMSSLFVVGRLTGGSATGRVNIDGTGSTVSVDANAFIGHEETGILTVSNGGQFSTTQDMTVGNTAASSGTVTQTSGSIGVTNNLIVGNSGTGKYTISGGSTMVGGTTTIGASGTLSINGGGLVTNSLDNTSGGTLNHNNGTLTIDGGTYLSGVVGEYDIDGSTSAKRPAEILANGATWTQERVFVARVNQGVLKVNSGSTLTVTDDIIVGQTGTASGSVTVDGSGSSISVTDAIVLGNHDSTTGHLFVSNNAVFNSARAFVADETGTATGTLNVRSGATANIVDVKVNPGGTVNVDGGSLLTTNLNNAGGIVNLTDGLLTVSNTFTPGSNFSMTGGELDVATLSGDWTFSGGLLDAVLVDGMLTQSGGTLAPGDSPGVTTITGDYLLSGGSLDMELAGLLQGTQYDFLDIDGDWTITGGVLDVSLLGAYDPVLGSSFDLFDFNSLTGTFDTVNLPTLSTELKWNTDNLYSSGLLSVTAVPEPSATVLLALGAIGLIGYRRRKMVSRRATT